MTPEQLENYLTKRRQELDQERELSSRGNIYFSQKPREVSKDKKIKRCKDSSRLSEEQAQAEMPSAPVGRETRDDDLPIVEDDNKSADRDNLTSRGYTGISVYHNRTQTGVKVNITLQTAQDAKDGYCIEITGELKQQDRFREIKRYDGDDDYFKQFVEYAIEHYRKEPDNYAIGRAHTRGKRDAWFKNTLVVGKLQDQQLAHVVLFLDSDRYDIPLTMSLNTNQQKYFHSGGIYGSLQTVKSVPSLATAERKRFK